MRKNLNRSLLFHWKVNDDDFLILYQPKVTLFHPEYKPLIKIRKANVNMPLCEWT